MSRQQPRRKGNAQTASSSRAAELLQASGISIPYLGLDALSLSSGLPKDLTSDVTAFIDEIGANVDPELRIIFKKLTKKDLQTREKGMKELLEALKESTNDYGKIKNAFPSYASIYSKLVTDSSSSLRSLSNAILALFITTLKKEAGSYIKSVIPFLLFSLQDGYNLVSKSAEIAVNDCFPTEEKKKLAMDTFGKDTSIICLQMMAKEHILIQPQKFVEEESDAQRKTRLIAQSLNTLETLLEFTPNLTEIISPAVITSQSFSNLMTMDNNVKAASFRILNKLIKFDASPLFGTRIPAFILQHLDSNDTLLCRNAFECFLTAGKDARFFETLKIDKAIIPKFLSLVRKKQLYWQILETSLLPSISIIYDNLPDEKKEKWLTTILDSFFDGIESGLPLFSWSKAFVEAIKFSFVKAFANEESKEFQVFLIEKVFTFLDIVIPFKDKKDVIPIVADLLTWLQSKDIQFDGGKEAFNKRLSEKLISRLPSSSNILETFVEASNDFTVAVELLKSYECPNSTFLKVFKSLDQDAIDTSQFGIIIARRIHKEYDFGIQQKLIKLLWDLIDDGQVKEKLDSFLKIDDPMIARNLVEISNVDLIEALKPSSCEKITEVVLTEVLKGHPSSKLAEWINKAIKNEQAIKLIQIAIKESLDHLEFKPFLDFIKVTSTVKAPAEFYKYLFEVLFDIIFKHETSEEEDDELFKEIKSNVVSLGNHFDENWLDFVLSKINDEGFPIKDVVRLAKLLASLSLKNEAMNLILPSEAAVNHLISNIGSMFILNIVCEPEKHRLFQACYFGKTTSGPIANLSITTRFAVFYSHLAYEISKASESNDEKGIFSKTSLYALLTELAIEYKSENGMFSTTLNDFHGFHELFILIDKMLQDPRFDYKDSLESIKKHNSHSYLVLLALNDSLKSRGYRHTSFDIIYTPSLAYEDGEAYHMIRVCEEVGRKMVFTESTFESAVNYIENYITEKREQNESWLFNIDGNNEIQDAASCAMLKLFITLIENVNLKPNVNDFMLCGFVCAMQTVTDSFKNVKGRHYFYSQLAAVYCLQLIHSYETFIAKRHRSSGLEWNEFYRPAASAHIMSWLFALEPSANSGFPQYLINKICITAQMLTPLEIKESIIIPEEIKNLDEPIDLSWNNYEENTKAIVKFSIRLLFGKSNDAAKFLAIYFLKSLMFDMYDAEKPKPIKEIIAKENPENETAENAEGETMEQQLKEATYEEERKLPTLFEKVLSPESSAEINVLPKLMVWDSLINFLTELDVSTRVQYTLHLPVKYTDEILNVLFTLLPKDLENRLKELTYKGKLTVQNLFAQRFDFRQPHATTLDHYVCNLFFRTISTLPSFVRTWYMDLPRSRSGEVHDYIKKYLSPLIIARELNSLGNIHKGRLTVKVMAAVNEITAAYRFEDATLTLKISLPDDYPLSKPTIDAQKAIINKDLLRKWLLQLMMFLSQQNGLMIDGILLWKRNIDNHLEGVEDCTICMMTVSATNYSLPKIKCRQCRKKFHGDCLYKWFDTSNNATCPLCRSPFYY